MKKLIFFCIAVIFLNACAQPQTKTQRGAAYGAAGGAAAGAILGQVIGRNTKGTLIGAAIGTAVGGLAGAGVGRMMDQQEAELNQALATSEAAAVSREGNLIAITLKGDVTFDTNSSIIRPGLYSEIDRIANVLVRYPQTYIKVEGHTDSKGTEVYNLRLSEQRSNAVKDLLVQRGVDASRIEVLAFGESNPVASNDTETGRQLNRRVEIKVSPQSS